MSTKYSISFVIFNIFTIYISCFCAICILFFIEPTHIFFLLPFFCSTHFAVPCIFCSICSIFPFFTIFSAIATVSAAISCLFAPSFCLFAAYQLILFHFYFIYKNESCYGGLFKFTEKFNEVSCKLKKETPSLFRSSVSDICSSFVLYATPENDAKFGDSLFCYLQVLSPFRKVTSTICSISSIFFPSIMRMMVSTLRFAISGTF